MRRSGQLLGLAVLALVFATARGLAAEKSHPRLVSVAATQCITCHKAVTEGKSFLHPPAADCATCHEVKVSEAGTRVALQQEGAALCLSCHDGLAAAAKGTLKASHPPVAEACVTCHNPHASNTERLLVSPIPELCTTCHDLASLQGSHGGQLGAQTDCRTCHVPHGSANPHMLAGSRLHPPFADGSCEACHLAPLGGRTRLRARGERLCAACHGDMAKPAAEGGGVHPALRGTRTSAGCLSCHNPHMSQSPRLLVKEGPALCAKCHDSVVKAATAKTGHPAASEDCLSCHQPHTSKLPRLLSDRPPALCLNCHDADGLKKPHLGAEVVSLDCVSCHTPHGAGNPKLLAKNVHPPVLEDCAICHEGSSKKLVENGESALCLMCHEDIGKLASSAKVPHPAMEVARCADCHNPHASPQERLVKAPGGGPCLVCHDDKAPGPGEFGHGAIALLGCRACHEPHGGQNPTLLRKTGSALCLGCHDPASQRVEKGASTIRLLDRFEVPAQRARDIATLRLSKDGERNHPVPGHRVIGRATAKELKQVATTFDGELGCLTCHDPHKGRARQLFRWNAASSAEACAHCHLK